MGSRPAKVAKNWQKLTWVLRPSNFMALMAPVVHDARLLEREDLLRCLTCIGFSITKNLHNIMYRFASMDVHILFIQETYLCICMYMYICMKIYVCVYIYTIYIYISDA